MVETRVLCVRVAGVPASGVVPGSQRAHCNKCEAEVWVSPASFRDLTGPESIVCVDCVPITSAATITEATAAAVAKALGVRYTESFHERLREVAKEVLNDR